MTNLDHIRTYLTAMGLTPGAALSINVIGQAVPVIGTLVEVVVAGPSAPLVIVPDRGRVVPWHAVTSIRPAAGGPQ